MREALIEKAAKLTSEHEFSKAVQVLDLIPIRDLEVLELLHKNLTLDGCVQQASEVHDRIHRMRHKQDANDTMMDGRVESLPVIAPQYTR